MVLAANDDRDASGHEGDLALASFSPRSQHLAIYLVGEYRPGRYESALARLGPHRPERAACTSSDSTTWTHDALRELIDRSVRVRKGIDWAVDLNRTAIM